MLEEFDLAHKNFDMKCREVNYTQYRIISYNYGEREFLFSVCFTTDLIFN